MKQREVLKVKEWDSVVEFGLRLTKQGNRNKVLGELGI